MDAQNPNTPNMPIQQLVPQLEQQNMSVAPQPAPVVQTPVVPQVPAGQVPVVPGAVTPVIEQVGKPTQYGVPMVQGQPVMAPPSQFAVQDPNVAAQVAQAVIPQKAQAAAEVPGAPKLEDFAEPVQEAMTTPTREQILQQFRALVQPVQAERARIQALDEVDKLRQQMDERNKQREADLQLKIKEIDDRVRTKSLPEIMQNGSFGAKLGAALAVLAGGVSQGLTGAKSNPVIDFMNQMVEQQAQRDKLSLDEKNMLQRQVLEQGQNELRRLENATQNAFRKDQLRLMQQQLQDRQNALMAKLQASTAAKMPADMYSGRELSQDEVLKARQDPKIAKQLVTLPNGKSFLAVSPDDKAEFRKNTTEPYKALTLLEEYKKLAKDGSKISFTDRAKADVLREAIVGALRLPFTGPGILTDKERENLIKTLGDPIAFTTIRPIEMAKIQRVIDSIKTGITNEARRSGISGQIFDDVRFYKFNDRVYREEKLLEYYTQRYPRISEDRLKELIRTQVPQL